MDDEQLAAVTEIETKNPPDPNDVWTHLYNTFNKEIKTPGVGTDTPMEASLCNFGLSSSVPPEDVSSHTAFEFDKAVDFVIGEADTEFDKEIEKCLMTMKAGESCDVSFNFKPTNGQVFEESKITPCSFKGILQLFRFVKGNELWEMEPPEKLKVCVHHKSKGVELFQQDKPIWAFYRFSKAMKFMLTFCLPEFDSDTRKEYDKLQLLCFNNMAACQLLTGKYEHVIKNTTRVLNIDNDNIKALFRRGTAYLHLQEFEKAEMDLKRVISVDPSNQAARQQLEVVRKKVKILEAGYAEAMKKFLHLE